MSSVVTSALNYLDPVEAINPKYTKEECKEYLDFVKCSVRVESVRDECSFPSKNQVYKCLPINPQLVSLLRRPESQMGTDAMGPVVTSLGFEKLYREGKNPNPN